MFITSSGDNRNLPAGQKPERVNEALGLVSEFWRHTQCRTIRNCIRSHNKLLRPIRIYAVVQRISHVILTVGGPVHTVRCQAGRGEILLRNPVGGKVCRRSGRSYHSMTSNGSLRLRQV